MKLNRRNALLGIGAIATGGGALFGSGAFSQVSANRAVTIDAAKDTNANLVLAANSSTTVANNSSGGSSNQVGINADKLNVDADTVYKKAVDITNQSGDSDNKLVAISSPGFSNGSVAFKAYKSVNDITSTVDLSSQYVTLNHGATLVVGLDITINDGASLSSESTSVTVEAVESSSSFTISGLNDSGETESN